jgi:hypothetical protein
MGDRSRLNVDEAEVVHVAIHRLRDSNDALYDDRSSATCDVSAIGAAVGVKSERSAARQATIISWAMPTLALCTVTVLRRAVAGLSPSRVDLDKATVVGDGKADPHLIILENVKPLRNHSSSSQ